MGLKFLSQNFLRHLKIAELGQDYLIQTFQTWLNLRVGVSSICAAAWSDRQPPLLCLRDLGQVPSEHSVTCV